MTHFHKQLGLAGLMVAAWFAVPAPVQAQDDTDPNYLACLAETDPATGRTACTEALKSDKLSAAERAGALRALGRHQRRAGALGEATRTLDQSLALAPASAATWVESGDAHYEAGRFDEARLAYTRALARDRNMVRALNNRAVAHAALGDFDAAFEDFRMALTFAPDRGIIWNNRANVNCRAGRSRPSLEDRIQALYRGRFTASSAQAGLRATGFYDGPADGIWGPDSEDALLSWTEAGCPRAPKTRLLSR